MNNNLDKANSILKDHTPLSFKVKKKLMNIYMEDLKNESEDGWIWVEGYKGTDIDMKCMDYQYELGKVFTHEGEIKECSSGFHMCLKLHDVFRYYGIGDSPNRYFKVRALVRVQDYIASSARFCSVVTETNDHYDRFLQSHMQRHMFPRKEIRRTAQDKIVAKEIEFIEELEFKDIGAMIKREFRFIDCESKWEEVKKARSVNTWLTQGFISNLEKNGMSKTLAMVVGDDLKRTYGISYKYQMELKRFESTYVGLIETGVSKDMAMYILLSGMNKNNTY